MPASSRRRLLRLVSLGLVLVGSTARAQSPELAMRELASGQIKKGVRSIGFGGDGATWGNYALVYRDAGGVLADEGTTTFDGGNTFRFAAVGAATPALWHGMVIYALALTQGGDPIAFRATTPALGAAAPLVGHATDHAIFSKIAMPLGHGFAAGLLVSYETSRMDATAAGGGTVNWTTAWRPSGGAGVSWQPSPRLLLGVRGILNQDAETRTDAVSQVSGVGRAMEGRVGASVLPWDGAVVDLGETWLRRRNALTGAVTVTTGPNVGLEQRLSSHLVVRGGLDETSYGTGLTAAWQPLKLEVAYVTDLGMHRIGPLFGASSRSLLFTLTWQYARAGR